MTNLLQDGVTWLGGKLKDHAGVSVTYQRGTDSVSITATPTLHEYQVVDDEGFGIMMLSRDYLVHAADLVLNGSAISPRSGDRVIETIDGVSQTFELMPLGQLHEYQPADPDGTLLILHTKKVA
jgi:hypothetical protein